MSYLAIGIIITIILLAIHFGINILIIIDDFESPNDFLCNLNKNEAILIFFFGWILLLRIIIEEIIKEFKKM